MCAARRAVLCGVAAILALAAPAVARAQAPSVRFTVSVPGAYLRAAPSLGAARAAPVFEGDVLEIRARTANDWLQLAGARATGWMHASLGEALEDAGALPMAPAPRPPRSAARASVPSWVVVPPAARSLYLKAVAAGRNPAVFAIAGDCNSEPHAFTGRLAAGLTDISDRADLRGVADAFAPSFFRRSQAVHGSFGTEAMLDAAWANPAVCKPGEGPLACELRDSKAGIILIALGTGDQFAWREFESRLGKALDLAVAMRALPVLMTKADALESQQSDAPPDAINQSIRRLAAARGVPLIDFAKAARALPNDGLLDEGNSDFHLSPAGADLRLIGTLHVLRVLTR